MKNDTSTILIVDDNPQNLQVLAQVIEENGYETVLAMNGKQVFEYVSVEKPDLILLDIMMPEMDGYEVCSILKKDSGLVDVPVIFLTAMTEPEDIVKGFEAGGVDYITKPFNALELKIRVKNHLQLKKAQDELKKFNEELQNKNNELVRANEMIETKNSQLKEMMSQLEIASKTDPLTGLYNRRHIMSKIEDEFIRFKRNMRRFCICICDIDYFKKINDTYGHDCGDYVLKMVSKILKETVREQDLVARWGGEEFLLFLPETELEGAKVFAERMREKVEQKIFEYNNIKVSITMTFGLSVFDKGLSIDKLIQKADKAMYDGKNKGRNLVVAT